MVKIWAKIYREKKIAKSFVYAKEEPFRAENFFSYLTDICAEFDIPVPVVLSSNLRHFQSFHNVRFRASSFLESVDFDFLQLEDVAE